MGYFIHHDGPDIFLVKYPHTLLMSLNSRFFLCYLICDSPINTPVLHRFLLFLKSWTNKRNDFTLSSFFAERENLIISVTMYTFLNERNCRRTTVDNGFCAITFVLVNLSFWDFYWQHIHICFIWFICFSTDKLHSYRYQLCSFFSATLLVDVPFFLWNRLHARGSQNEKAVARFFNYTFHCIQM